MSNKIQVYTVSMATGTQSTGLITVDKYDQLMLRVPAVLGVFSSSVIAATLKGSPDINTAAKDMSYFDYVNKTPATCVVTISTGGIYEIPYPGSSNFVSISFDVVTSNITNVQLFTPKTTY